jgi:hypothetical protein
VRADVAKLADALDLGSSSCNGSVGSSPIIRTKKNKEFDKKGHPQSDGLF